MKKVLIGLMCAAMLCAGGCSMEREEILNSADTSIETAATEIHLTDDEEGTSRTILFDNSQEDEAEETTEEEDSELIEFLSRIDSQVKYGKYMELEDSYVDYPFFNFSEDRIDDYLELVASAEKTNCALLEENKFQFSTFEFSTMRRIFYYGNVTYGKGGELALDYRAYSTGSDKPSPQKEVLIDSGADHFSIPHMQNCNSNSSFCFDLHGARADIHENDKIVNNLHYLPPLNMRLGTESSGGTYKMYAKNDFLCIDTYGAKLKTPYIPGEKFKIRYNYFDCFMDDIFSPYNTRYDDAEKERQLDMTIKNFDFRGGISGSEISDFNTTIEFQDGKWEWYDKNGNLINTGEYQESEKYNGLIVMYVTEDSMYSDHNGTVDVNGQRIFFYIADGGIYYPAFIKTE